MATKDKRLLVPLDAAMKEYLQQKSAAEGESMASIARRAIRNLMAAEPLRVPKPTKTFQPEEAAEIMEGDNIETFAEFKEVLVERYGAPPGTNFTNLWNKAIEIVENGEG